MGVNILPLYFSIIPKSSTFILISTNSLSNSSFVFFIFSTFRKHCLKLCSNSEYLAFGVAASLNHSSAGESDFNHNLTMATLCSSDGIAPRPIRLQLMVFRNSVGCIASSCVPENSVILIC